MTPLPWTERINMLSINPDAASRQDIAMLASDLSALTIAAVKLIVSERAKKEGGCFYPHIENVLFHMGALPEQYKGGR